MNLRPLVRRSLQSLLWVVASCAATAAWSQAAPKEGVDYRLVQPAQPTNAPAGKVEAIEFFGYWCPHCNEFEPTMSDWAKRNEGKVVTNYVPIAFNASMQNLQKLYYTLDALGKEKELRRKVFSSIHVDRSLPPSPEPGQLADWAEKNGIDKKKFIDTFNSFTVTSKVNRANQIAQAYGVDAVPLLGIGGKYLVTVDSRRIGNADYFVGQVLAGK